MNIKQIQIRCKGTSVSPLDSLQNFQGNLKELELQGWNIDGIYKTNRNNYSMKIGPVIPIICDHCGGMGWNLKSNFLKSKYHFCSLKCYQSSDQKKSICINASRNSGRIKRLRERNKTQSMREKVSLGLKARKQKLGELYHSPESLKKIGNATKQRWEFCKYSILPILIANSESIKDKTSYGHTFRQIRTDLAQSVENACIICNRKMKRMLAGHHILPTRFGGKTDVLNIVPLCAICHRRIEIFQWRFARKLETTGKFKGNLWWIVYAYFNNLLRGILDYRIEQRRVYL